MSKSTQKHEFLHGFGAWIHYECLANGIHRCISLYQDYRNQFTQYQSGMADIMIPLLERELDSFKVGRFGMLRDLLTSMLSSDLQVWRLLVITERGAGRVDSILGRVFEQHLDE